jgi:8-oxo-dGTP pyrophosphatase MutT (NUDIX family)
MKGDRFMLPGGSANRGEPRLVAAIRELKEEADLEVSSLLFLFESESSYCSHKVFYARTSGVARPKSEIAEMSWSQDVRIEEISRSSVEIMGDFYELKRRYSTLFEEIALIPSTGLR